jgi:hypothetical protein
MDGAPYLRKVAGEQRRAVARMRGTRQEDLIAKVFKILRGFQ